MSAIPKSLHTVTAVVRVAMHARRRDCESGELMGCAYYVLNAFELLGYVRSDEDPHGLRAKSVAAMEKELGQ